MARLLSCSLTLVATATAFAQSMGPAQDGPLAPKTIAIVPTTGNFYLGRPNLRTMKEELRGAGSRTFMQRLYEDPTIFERRLDEESTRIIDDLQGILARSVEARGCAVRRLTPPAVAEEAINRLQNEFWLAVSADTRDRRTSVEGTFVAGVAGNAGADALLMTRFWGWRRGTSLLPPTGYTKSAAHLWVGLIDGASGELTWVGEGEDTALLLVSKYGIQNLDKIVAKAFKTLPPNQPCADSSQTPHQQESGNQRVFG